MLDIDLEEARFTPEMIPDLAEKIAYHAEQPHGDFSFFLFYMLAKRANSQGKIVLFNGDGPDEALGGQYLHSRPDMDFSLPNYFEAISYMDDTMRRRVLTSDFERSTPHPLARFHEILEPWKNLDVIDQLAAYECTSLMPGNNLVKGDRMGSCWSIEGRAPMLDHRISELFIRLPIDQKFQNGIGKYYLKNYAASKLPYDLIFKKKTMPTVPIGEWMKTTLYGWAHDVFSRHDGSFFNTKAVLAVLEEHKSGTHNHTRALRTLLMTQLWVESCTSRHITTDKHQVKHA